MAFTVAVFIIGVLCGAVTIMGIALLIDDESKVGVNNER